MKLVYDVTRKEWPGAALTAPTVADTGRGADVANGTCSIEGCENGGKITRGWCRMHYTRWQRHGDPFRLPPTPEDRFWAKVDKNGPDGFHSQTGENLGPCWLWKAPPDRGGYGRLGGGGRRVVLAHRFSYELLVGPIPTGLQPDHLCRVRLCVRPDHLEPVTSRENTLRGNTIAARNAVKTHCVRGHEFTPENTILRKGGCRGCRVCQQVHDAAYRARRQAA